jgi:hypothetical protein
VSASSREREREREREILLSERERIKTAEGRGEKFFLLSFLSFSCFSYESKRGVEDPSCGSESVSAVKKDGHRNARRRRIFFCSDIHSFSFSLSQNRE